MLGQRDDHATTTFSTATSNNDLEDILEDTCAVGRGQYCDAGDAGLEDTPKGKLGHIERARRQSDHD